MRAAVKQVDGIKLKSLYFGDGQSWELMIEGVIRSRDYARLDGWTDQLQSILASQGRYVRPMTLLIADTNSREGDVVDTAGLEIGNRGRRLREMVAEEYAAMFRYLTNDELHELTTLFEKYRRKFTDTAFERYFLGMFEARVALEYKLLQEKLSFLPDIEAWMVDLLEREVLPTSLGAKHWFSRVVELADAAGVPRAPKEAVEAGGSRVGLTLGQYSVLVGQMIGRGELLASALETHLGSDWQARLSDVIAFRNSTLHGKLRKVLGNDWTGWAKIVAAACEAGFLYLPLAEKFDVE